MREAVSRPIRAAFWESEPVLWNGPQTGRQPFDGRCAAAVSAASAGGTPAPQIVLVGLVLSVSILCSPAIGLAKGWPTYRGDAARSAYTSDPLPAKLFRQWTLMPKHAPQPAWPRDDRMAFDRAHHVVVADGRLFFGSSADCHVYALDAATGAERWRYCTDAPVRFAPTVWKDRLYVVSDDGYLYCLSTVDGTLINRWRGGPADSLVLGNGRIVSKWPARGGPVIRDGILYWAAGIWQSEGIFIYAIDADTGQIVWTNDKSGGIYMPQPHGGANAKSGVTAQGYLLTDAQHLFVPTGRAVPAAFSRADGKFEYYRLQENTKRGSAHAMAAGAFVFNGGYAFEAGNGGLSPARVDGVVCGFPDGVIHGAGDRLRALKPIVKVVKDRKGTSVNRPDLEELWQIEGVPTGTSLLLAGNTIVSSAGKRLTTAHLQQRQRVFTTEVDDVAYGLSAADGRLYVSTASGAIHCFSGQKVVEPVTLGPQQSRLDPAQDVAAAAAEIIKRAGVTAGYCVDLACGDGRLCYELARQTQLQIIGVDADADNVAAARKMLSAAGLYGVRITVLLGDPAKTELPKYMADLVVSRRSLVEGDAGLGPDEVQRLQRPFGGVTCLGRSGAMRISRRGPLQNAGEWTHQYSNAANTLCSDDTIKGPLSVLWFRDVDFDLAQRHGRAPAPLFLNGRLFAQGLNGLQAIDAYNGRPLWQFEQSGILDAYNADHLAGTAVTGSNFCVAGDRVYLRNGNNCFVIDATTGAKLATFKAPNHKDGKPADWGYIAVEDGILFGSLVNQKHIVRHAYRRADGEMQQQYSESDTLFALDAGTGELQWRYDAKHSIRHNAIAIGGGRVFLIDRPLAADDLLSRAPARRGDKPKTPATEHPLGELVTLNARGGQRQWNSREDVFGTTLVFSQRYDLLLMSYQPTRFKLPSEVGGKMAVYRADEGYRLWERQVKYSTRPLLNDRTIIAHPSALDLLTGEPIAFEMAKSYGCGQLAGSKHLLMFRSGTFGYLDFTRKAGTENFGGLRPGCWVNSLAVGGLVLIPDASAGCSCSYQNRAWVALQGSD